jgi:hypothetical protein
MNPSAPRVTSPQIESLYDYLKAHANGLSNAKTARHLAAALHLGKNGDRVLRALANAATASGLLICTGNEGYWLPATQAEAEETIGRIASQGAKMLQRANELRALVAQKYAVQKHRRDFDPNQLQLGL